MAANKSKPTKKPASKPAQGPQQKTACTTDKKKDKAGKSGCC